MDKFSKKFNAHSRTFLDFAKASNGVSGEELQYEIIMDLINLADNYSETADFISEESFIVGILETETDKREVIEILRKRVHHIIQEIDNITIHQININLAHSKKDAVVAEGNKLKDDLNDFKEALQAITDNAAQKGDGSAIQK